MLAGINYEKTISYNQTNHNKHFIHNSPKEMDKNTENGHKEGDAVVKKDERNRLLTHVDRLTGIGSISFMLGSNTKKYEKP